MTPWQQMLGYAIIMAIIFGGGWTTRGWKDNAALKAADDAIVKAQQTHYVQMQAIAKTYEEQRQSSQNTISQLQQQVRDSHAKNPASICPINPDSLRTIHSAIHSTAR